MKRKMGIVVFTHGSRRPAGNEIVLRFVERLGQRLPGVPVEPCFMELGQPRIPVALKRLVRQGCQHIYGYALFLVPGNHLSEDIPFIFERTLKEFPHVTWAISPPMLDDPLLLEFVVRHLEAALAGKSC